MWGALWIEYLAAPNYAFKITLIEATKDLDFCLA
jgi:hypothetical protein